jgi:uncharacterized protein YbjT (DUF2867 family)
VRTVLIAGASGLIGGHVVKDLAERSDIQIVALLRREIHGFPANVRQVVVEFSEGSDGLIKALTGLSIDVVICAIGTTLREAGTKEAFFKIDHDIPIALLSFTRTLAAKPRFIFVSSVGADQPVGFYLETKFAVEKEILESKLPSVLVRPSLLLGARSKRRFGEDIAQKVMPGFFSLLSVTPMAKSRWLKKYRPVDARAVAKAIVAEVFSEHSHSQVVLEGDDFLGAKTNM